jgi:plasmid stabilization system protein ParE
MGYKLRWTEEAAQNLDDILDYFERRWTEKETFEFKRKLSALLLMITENPLLFPVSDYRSDLRRAVLSNQTSIYYLVKKEEIHLIFLFDNRMDTERLKN